MHHGLTQRLDPGAAARRQCLPRRDARRFRSPGRKRSPRSSAASSCAEYLGDAFTRSVRGDATRRDAGVQLVHLAARLRLVPDDELSRPHDHRRHIHSYYAATANPAPRRPQLEGELDGRCLRRRRRPLRLLDCAAPGRARLPRGVARGAPHRLGRLRSQRRPGDRRIRRPARTRSSARSGSMPRARMWDVSVEAVDLLKERIRRHAIDCDLHWGQMHVAVKPRHVTELKAWQQEMTDKYAYPGTRWLERDEVREWIASERYLGGLLRPAQRPPAPAQLHARSRRRGRGRRRTDLREQRGDAHRPRRSRHASRRPAGRVRARHVAICCNAWIDDLVPELRSRIMPVGTYIVATESLGEARMRALLRGADRGLGRQLGARLLPAARPIIGCCSAAGSATRGSTRATRAPRRANG